MELVLMKSLWGMEGPQEQSLKRIAESGYQGVEAPVPPPKERKRFRGLLRELGLSYIPLIFTASPGSAGASPGSAHAESFDTQLSGTESGLIVTSRPFKVPYFWNEYVSSLTWTLSPTLR